MKIIQNTQNCYETDSIKTEYLQEGHYILEVFKKFATPEEIQVSKTKFLNMVEEFKPQYYLSDLRKFVGAPTESINWVRDTWLPKIHQLGIKGIAIVQTKDIFAEEALHGVLVPENKVFFTIKNFNTPADAEAWILSQTAK
jgi:hypothetical protein